MAVSLFWCVCGYDNFQRSCSRHRDSYAKNKDTVTWNTSWVDKISHWHAIWLQSHIVNFGFFCKKCVYSRHRDSYAKNKDKVTWNTSEVDKISHWHPICLQSHIVNFGFFCKNASRAHIRKSIQKVTTQ